MASTNRIIEEILNLGLDDWINLPEVAEIVSFHESGHDSYQVLAESLKIVRQLLSDDLARAGDLVKNEEAIEFRSWDLDVDAIISEIERRWSQYGAPYDKATGEFVCWLSNTEKGDDVAQHRGGQESLHE